MLTDGLYDTCAACAASKPQEQAGATSNFSFPYHGACIGLNLERLSSSSKFLTHQNECHIFSQHSSGQHCCQVCQAGQKVKCKHRGQQRHEGYEEQLQ